MAARKVVVSVSERVMRQVDEAVRCRGMSRSGFVSRVLACVADARTDAEISRRIDALFATREPRPKAPVK